MSHQQQLRRGSTADHSTFTGVVGEVTVDTDKDVVVVHDGSTAGGIPASREDHTHVYEPSKGISMISPTGADVVMIYHTNHDATIIKIHHVVVGATPSIDFTLYKSDNRDDVSPVEVITGGTTANDESGADVTVFDDDSLTAGDKLWISTSNMTGTVDEFHVTVHFEETY